MLSDILSSKIVLVVATLIGMAICAPGIGRIAAQGQWLNPFAIVGSVLGAVLLLIVGAAMFNIKLPLIDSTRAAFIALIVLVIVKVALTQLHARIG